jgi:hypothetical protein
VARRFLKEKEREERFMKRIEAKQKMVIEIEVVDINGNSKILKSQYITIKGMSDAYEINRDEKLNPFDKVALQVARYFGGTKEDYEIYDIDTLTQVINAYSEESSKNSPTKPGTKEG